MQLDASAKHLRHPLAIALAAAAMLLAPAAAHASYASVDSHGKLTYQGASTEANHVVATSPTPGTITLTETGTDGPGPVTVSAGSRCSKSGNAVTCTGVGSFEIKTGDVSDFVDTSAVTMGTTVNTGNGDDHVYTGPGNDFVYTDGGDDFIDGGLGSDWLTGGFGSDVVSYASHSASQAVTATLDGFTGDGCAACGERDTISADVEAVTGSPGNDTLTGGRAANVLSGAAGDDTLNGAAGNDTLDGGAGSDNLNGGDGDDTLSTRDASVDQLTCGAGNDGGSADPADVIAADCERVGTGASDPLTNPIAPEAFNLVPPVIPEQVAKVSSTGLALVRIGCPVTAGGCKGTADLFLLGSSRSATRGKIVAARRRPTRLSRLGRAKFVAEAGKTAKVPIRLYRRGRRRVLRGGRTRCRLVVTTRSATGKTVTTTRDITLLRRTARRVKKRR
jgi:hypothetical protein